MVERRRRLGFIAQSLLCVWVIVVIAGYLMQFRSVISALFAKLGLA